MRVQNSAVPTQAIRKPPTPPPRPFARRQRLDEECGTPLPPPVPSGGPLALHRVERRDRVEAPQAAQLVDRMIVGKTREGLPEVRLDVAVGALRGTEVRIAAGPGGLEATFVAATESARRVVEAQLADLARALEGRGLKVARCQVTMKGDRRPRVAGRSWEDAGE